MAAIERSFRPMHGQIRGPLLAVRLSLNGKESRDIVALVDTGATWTLVSKAVVLRELRISDAEIMQEPYERVRGIGGKIGKAYRLVIDNLILGADRAEQLLLPKAHIYVWPGDLPYPILLGQRCVLERLWLFHRNQGKSRSFLLGE